MLPKPEKIKKISASDQDVGLKEISVADKTRNKRRTVIIIISLTIGISTIFSIYNYFKNYHFTLPLISPPQVSLSKDPLESELKSILKSDYGKWSFTVQTNSTNPYFWSSNGNSSPQDFPTLAATIEQYHQPLDTSITSSLPQGLKIIQYKNDSHYQFVIVTPESQIYLDVVSPPDNENLSKIIRTMYWSLVKQ